MSCKLKYIRDVVQDDKVATKLEATHISIIKRLKELFKVVDNKLKLSPENTQKRIDQLSLVNEINKEFGEQVVSLKDDIVNINMLEVLDIDIPIRSETVKELSYIPDNVLEGDINKDLLLSIMDNEISKVERLKTFLKDERRKAKTSKEKAILSKRISLLEDKIESIKATQSLITEKAQREEVIAAIEIELDRLDTDTKSVTELSDMELNNYLKLADTFLTISELEEDHPLFNDELLDEIEVQTALSVIYNKAASIKRRLVSESDTRLTKDLNEKLDTKFTKADLVRSIADKDGITVNTMSIDRLGNEILDYMYNLMEKAQSAFLKATRSSFKEIDSILGKVKDFDIFKQRDSEGRLTGNIIHMFSQEFWDTKKSYLQKIQNASTKKAKAKAWVKFNKWKVENTLLFKRDLLQDTNYSNRLIQLLGIDEYNKRVEAMEEEYEKYEILLQEKEMELAKESEEDKSLLLSIFDQQYNPDKYGTSKVIGGNTIINYSDLPYVPKDESQYDTNWNKIKDNPDLYKAYSFIMELTSSLRELLPSNKRQGLQVNTLPYMAKTLTDTFREKGIGGLRDKLTIDMISDLLAESSGRQQGDINPITGEKELQAQLHLTTDQYEVDKEYEQLVIKAKAEGIIITDSIEKELKKEAKNIVAANKSWDIPSLLKMYMLAVNTYYYASQQEDKVLQAHRLFKSRKELVSDNKQSFEEANGLKNLNELTEYQIKRFFGIKTTKVEGLRDKKVYTAREKEMLKELTKLREKELAKAEPNTELIQAISKQINNLGRQTSWGKVIESILKYIHVKALGWNPLSATSNIVFGRIANYLEASNGRFFNESDLNLAYVLVGKSSFKKNLRVANIIYQLDVVKDGANELESLKSEGSENMAWFNPYKLNQLAETLNQGASAIAFLKNKKYLELFDENGTFTGTQEELDKIKLQITKMNNMIHGNYDILTSQMGKRTILGKTLFMFKTWLPEAVASRFQKERYDHNLKMAIKGRWRSYKSLLDGEDTMSKSIAMLKYYTHKMTRGILFKNEDLSNYFTEVDAQNMRANMAELAMLTNMLILSLVAKAALDDDDEKGSIRYMFLNILIGQLSRANTDLWLYASPSEAASLVENALPITQLINDVSQFTTAGIRALHGDDRIGSGQNAGESRLIRETFQLLPFSKQAYSLYSTATDKRNDKSMFEILVGTN